MNTNSRTGITRRGFLAAGTGGLTLAAGGFSGIIGGTSAGAAERHWADGLTRHCHIDSHFGGYKEVYRDFDAETAADMIADAGFQTVTFFAKCWAGYSYYPTRIGVAHPGLACDFTGDFARALKKRGIRRLVYFNLGQERRLHREHPEWIVNPDPEGRIQDRATLGDVASMCQRSPYLDESGIPQMLEIIDMCDVDGFFIDIFMHQTIAGVCYCPSCSGWFRRDTGLAMPKGDNDPSAFAYRHWANNTFNEVVERTFNALAAKKPGTLLLINWGWMARFPINPPPFIRQLTWDTPTPQVGNFAWNFSFESRYLSSLKNVTWSVMNTRGNNWMDYSLREPEALTQECATTVSAGGGTYLSDVGHPSGRFDPAVFNLFGRINRRSIELEPFTRGVEPVKDVAVLHSADSVWSKSPLKPCPTWPPELGYHSVCGTHKALVDGHVQTVILNSETLPVALDGYKALVLADQRILNDAECAAIRRFVERGGGLVAFAGTGIRNTDNAERGDFALADVLGVRFRGMTPFATSFLRVTEDAGIAGVPAMDVQVVGPSVRVETVTARKLLDFVPPYEGVTNGVQPAALQAEGPGVTVNTFGKGKAVYCAADCSAALFTQGTPMLRKLILWMVGIVHPAAARTIVVENAPVSVEVFYNVRGPERFVYLVNYGCDKRETGTPQTQDFPTLHNIVVSVALDGPPKRITGVPGGAPVASEYAGGRARFTAAPLGIHAVYRIET